MFSSEAAKATRFDGIYQERDAIVLSFLGQKTAERSKRVAPTLTTWEECELAAGYKDDILRTIKIVFETPEKQLTQNLLSWRTCLTDRI